jgi:hypothetical protein
MVFLEIFIVTRLIKRFGTFGKSPTLKMETASHSEIVVHIYVSSQKTVILTIQPGAFLENLTVS